MRSASLILYLVATLMAASLFASPAQARPEDADRDKTGTIGGCQNGGDSQVATGSHFASRVSFQAEGTGFEPATGFPAPHFQCGR